jgi:hypothetical protein
MACCTVIEQLFFAFRDHVVANLFGEEQAAHDSLTAVMLAHSLTSVNENVQRVVLASVY